MNSMTEKQWKRLPVWAKAHITILENKLAQATSTLNGIKRANPNSRVYYPVVLSEDIPLATDAIRFKMPSRSETVQRFIDVRLSMHWENRLEVRGVPDCITIYPIAGNAISIALDDQ